MKPSACITGQSSTTMLVGPNMVGFTNKVVAAIMQRLIMAGEVLPVVQFIMPISARTTTAVMAAIISENPTIRQK